MSELLIFKYSGQRTCDFEETDFERRLIALGFTFTIHVCITPGHTDWLKFYLEHGRGHSFDVITTTHDEAEAQDDVLLVAIQARPLGLIDP